MSNVPDKVDVDILKKQLEHHEGFVPYAYPDTGGYYTIGIGHLIDKRKGGSISRDSALYILNEDIESKCGDLNNYLPWYRDLDEVRQRVLIDMCFNLGMQGLLQFHNTLAHIQSGRYAEASKTMLTSKWAKQVGVRAKTLSEMMRTGKSNF